MKLFNLKFNYMKELQPRHLYKLAEGKRSLCYSDGEHIVKLSKQNYTLETAHVKLADKIEFYKLLQQYLGEYVIESYFSLRELPYGNYKLQTEQQHIQGDSWQGVLYNLKDNYDYRFIIDFLQRSAYMYENISHVPELYAPVSRLKDLNNISLTDNIRIQYKDGYYPYLIDVEPNLFSATLYGTLVQNRFLVNDIKKRLTNLSNIL